MAGKLSYYCYKYFSNKADYNRGFNNLHALLSRYPNSDLADDAYYYIGELYLKAGQQKDAAYYYRFVIQKYPKGSMARDARQRLEQLHYWPMPAWLLTYKPGTATAQAEIPPKPTPLPPTTKPQPQPQPQPAPEDEPTVGSGRVLIKEIKYFSSGTYTRVVIYCMRKADYSEPTYIPPDPAAGVEYPRMYIDVMDARIAPGVSTPKDINDGLLRRVRAGQNSPTTARVVLDIDSIDRDKTRVIPMEDRNGDFRIVIDVTAKKPPTAPANTQTQNKPPEPEKHTVRRIVIDPGHGGNDPGAIGPSGVKEKDVTLKLALKTVKALEKKLDAIVTLTRTSDKYLSLEERTAYANVVGADVFVSLHANAAVSPLARGIETFILDTTNDESAKKLAANENRVSLDALDQFQKDPLLFTLFQKAKADESYDLARVVHKFIIEGTRKDFNDVFDHGVKEGPFFVLMGATMPCVLIETSFISNPEEEKRLQSDDYLDALADSIVEGLAEYSRRRRSGQVHDL
jgi:N-acetylmuramoyl-L-alanine amidase